MSRNRLMPDWLKRLRSTPVDESDRWQHYGRFFMEVGRHGAKQLSDHRASQMAAALAFRTIFSLIPVVIVATLIFRAFGGAAFVSEFVNEVLHAASLDQVASPQEGVTVAEWARQAMDNLNANLQAGAISVVSVLVFAWSAVGLLTTIERCFNTICHAPQSRPIGRRLQLYWMTITVGPALLYLSFVLEKRIFAIIQSTGMGDSTAGILGSSISFCATWLFLLLLYKFMPYARVNTGACIAGAFVAALLWTGTTDVFNAFLERTFSKESSPFTLLYATLGVVPLFMLWVYLLWVIILYGLEVTSLLHTVGTRMVGGMPVRKELPALTDPAAIIPVMRVIADQFDTGQKIAVSEIVEETGLHERAVTLMVDALVAGNLVHRIEEEEEPCYALARPAGSIKTSELLGIAHKLTTAEHDRDDRGWTWVRSLHQAELELGVHKPLAEI